MEKEGTVTRPQVLGFSIKDRKPVAADTTEVVFDTGENNLIFRAGQYIRLTIPEIADDAPKGNTRDFTIVSSPDFGGAVAIAFRNSDSEFKKSILKLPIGSKIRAQGPLGAFTLPEDASIPVVFIAGGIGVTPFVSMMRFVAANKTGHRIHVVYVNSSKERAAYTEEIKSVSKANPNIVLTEKIGEVTVEFIKENVKYNDKTLWYLCGVPEMTMALVRDIPKLLNVPAENIRMEEYVGYNKNRKSYKVLPPVGDKAVELVKDDFWSDKGLVQAFVDTVGEGALVAVTDSQGSIQYINDKFIEISKYSKEELIGQNHRILKSGFHPPEFYDELWQTISSGKTWRGELKNRAKDGSFYWVDTSVTPIFGDDKVIDRYVAVRFLITDKKNLEKSKKEIQGLLSGIEDEKNIIKSEQEKLSAILQSIGDGVFVIDEDRKIILINDMALKLSGYSRPESIKKHYRETLKFVVEEEKKENNAFIENVFETGEIQEMPDRTELIKKDGSKIPVADSAAPLNNQRGEVMGAIVVFRDVTREREVDRAKTEFVSLASHQLRTPLSAINWYSEILMAGDAGDLNEEQKQHLEEIYQGNQRMVGLIDALLNTSRIDMGTFAIEPEPISFTEVAESVVKELTPKIKQKEQVINKKFDKNLPATINADPKLMRIIFQNLLSNAVKYTPEKGTVTLEISKQDKDVLIKIADTGYGIPKAQQKKVFQKLFRADNVIEKETEGTGLGLYIVKAIIEESGGSVRFESEENKGTTFFVTIPVSGMKLKEGTRGLSA